MSHTFSIGERSGDLASQGNMSTLCRACWVTTTALIWPPSNQHTAITENKAELAFIRKHNRSPLRPPMSSSLTPLTLQMAVVWSQWNARHRASGLELSLNKEYKSPDPPRVLLDKLELRGYRVVAMAGIGQTCIWTLNKPPEFE
ncbi:hypothetical protein AVEN_6408-1 [Araneus ventricosus]|uniref:GTP cyclohydrolase 1 feedback regulatory protein n=1 Tax=Araneus ventricosus TaxID=182803 RepID=A0A4Y2LWK7_ARAVE|nr:hypothetical protein AVEN_6408-1 [Araneus ventricosus]